MADIDSNHFRNILGHAPTSVVVVSGLDAAAEPQGITIGSFASVSLSPPLVGFFVGLSSRTWSLIEPQGSFCVNVLAADQSELCWRFAKESENRFDGVEWNPAPSGSPILGGVTAWVDCSVHSVSEIGDHYLVVGEVRHLDLGESTDSAMVFFRGKIIGAELPTDG